MTSPIIVYVYKIMLGNDWKIIEDNKKLKWNKNGADAYNCHRDRGFFLKYWNYK